MGFAHRASVAAGVGFAAAAIAGCGSSGGRLLSQSQANRLTAELNNVQQTLDDGECTGAQRYLTQFQNDLNQLGSVNATLVANLNQGASTIQSLTNASSECKSDTVTTPKKTSTTKTRTTPTTTTTATQTVPTFTEPTTTYPTQTYSTPTYSTPTTSTTGGQGIGSNTNTLGTTSTPSTTTTPSGGTGLGDTYTATTDTTTDTTATTQTDTTGTGY